MKTTALPVLASSVLALMLSVPIHAQSDECQRVEFSQSVLERLPKAPESCLDVIERDGEKFAVMKADLISVSGSTLRVRVKHPDGGRGPTQSIRTSPDFRVLIDGKPTRVSELAPGQELTAYVKVTEPQMALEPAVKTATLVVVPIQAEETRQAAAPEAPATMPETASKLPLIGATGALLLILGFGLTAIRRLRA